MPIIQPLSVRTTLPQISALPIQRGVPTLQPLSVRATPPPPLYVSLQGICVLPLIPSAMRAYDTLIW